MYIESRLTLPSELLKAKQIHGIFNFFELKLGSWQMYVNLIFLLRNVAIRRFGHHKLVIQTW